MESPLTFLAGEKALAVVREEGLPPERVRVVTGAAGGPKWIALMAMDRWLFDDFFRGRAAPLHAIGASSGAWRFAAGARREPRAALEAFRQAYVHQRYPTRPGPEDVTAEGRRILSAYLGDGGAGEVLSHPWLRLSVLAVRARHLAASENPYLRGAGLAAAAVHNLAHRRLLGVTFDRTVFHDPRATPPLAGGDGIPTRLSPLRPENLRPALLASGSIPLVMSGVRGIPGAPGGTYLDGGIVDYHPCLPMDLDEADIVLFPHYTDRVIPGWLDKKLPWRRARAGTLPNVLLVAPSREFVRALPGGKVPDRTDFKTWFGKDDERIGMWEAALSCCERLGEDLAETVESGGIRRRVRAMG